MNKYGKIIEYNGSNGKIMCNEGNIYIVLTHNILYEDPKIGDAVTFKEEIYKTPEICERMAYFIKKIEKVISNTENYIEKHREKIVKTPGGNLCQVFGDKEGASCSVALVKMDEKKSGLKHYHDNITEIYLFSKGMGKIIINENENIIDNGDCYIIPPNNTHFITADSAMEFACICTPPWTEEHEFSTEEIHKGNNISAHNENGIIQKLSEQEEHNVKLLTITDYFKPNELMKKYRRVYYFILGNGKINIDDKVYDIRPGNCYEVLKDSNEYIKTNDNLKFIVVCDTL